MIIRLAALAYCLAHALAANTPPSITGQPDQVVIYQEGSSVRLLCVASGDPAPSYYWKKNDVEYTPDGTRVTMDNLGTLEFSDARRSDQAYYQCFAHNGFGTAVTQKVLLKRAFLAPFANTGEQYKTVPLGQALELSCTPPASVPEADIYWEYKRPGDERGSNLEYTARYNKDNDGDLWFANVQPEDSLNGGSYTCVAFNPVLRSNKLAADIRVLISTGPSRVDAGQVPQPERPIRLMSAPPSNVVAMKGETYRVKCIFSGYPTPTVTWERVDGGSLDSSRHDVTSSVSELIINDVQFSDAGKYKCVGSRAGGDSSNKEFTITVEATPYWLSEPRDNNAAEGEGADFSCQASGKPPPNIEWFINGVPIQRAEANERRHYDQVSNPGIIKFTNLAKSDVQVLQCNASNSHGWIFTNAYLNVLAEPPVFTEHSDDPVYVAEGRSVTIRCRSWGVPKPVMSWLRGEAQITDPRFQVMIDGDLKIQNVALGDEDRYTCVAVNKFGRRQFPISIIVKEMTRIDNPPTDATVRRGNDATFKCGAKTDPTLQEQLTIVWKKDGQVINVDSDESLSTEDGGSLLKISPASVLDSAEYTCEASNGLDTATASATLTVQGEPGPPTNVNTATCNPRGATITWVAGDANNSPILQYIIEYNTSYSGWKPIGVNASSYETSKDVALYPYNKYHFRVIARNAIGLSLPSKPTERVCETPAARPHRNPEDVRVVDEGPKMLVVEWTPVPRVEQCGPDFTYMIYTRRLDVVDQLHAVEVRDSDASRKVFLNVPTYKPYKVMVVSNNRQGATQDRDEIIGYSGEDVPMQVVQNFRLDESKPVTSTEASFLWDAVNEDEQFTRGFFVGYKIEFWKKGEPETKEHVDITLRDVADEGKEYRTSGLTYRYRRQSSGINEIEGSVNDLPPYSDIEAHVMVMNKRYVGTPSEIATCRTLEGVPGPIGRLTVDEVGPKHVTLSWLPPQEPNGVITGYDIEYEKLTDGHPGPRQKLDEDAYDPQQTSVKVSDLESDEEYYVYVYAKTKEGRGEPVRMKISTDSGGPPGPPTMSINGFSNTAMNVTWKPSNDSKFKPASAFYVQYKEKGAEEWTDTTPVSNRQWQNVTGLTSGVTYLVRVVATNGPRHRKASKTVEVALVEPTLGAQVEEASVAIWFIILIVLLALLLLVLLIICLVRHNQGQKYRIDDPQEENFEEFKRPDQPYTKSQASLESDTKPGIESDSDSMAAYDDDPTKFNEDGSFIGQYGAKKKPPPDDATTPTSMSTFV